MIRNILLLLLSIIFFASCDNSSVIAQSKSKSTYDPKAEDAYGKSIALELPKLVERCKDAPVFSNPSIRGPVSIWNIWHENSESYNIYRKDDTNFPLEKRFILHRDKDKPITFVLILSETKLVLSGRYYFKEGDCYQMKFKLGIVNWPEQEILETVTITSDPPNSYDIYKTTLYGFHHEKLKNEVFSWPRR